MSERSGSTLQELVADALRDVALLARSELSLFKAEVASNLTGLAKGAAMFLAAAIFAVASLIWLTQALVYGLVIVLGSLWLAALVVGILLLAVAGGLAWIGKNMLFAAKVAPDRTIRSLKRDGDVIASRAP